MPNISEMNAIYQSTPVDQPILLKAIHGVGKSETIKAYFEAQGCRVIPFFLGQMSDAGDILGLPDRIEKDGVKVTVFCPPIWWPTDKNEKVVLFLDELNRAKPELTQVIMDLVLNRKLAGRDLPENCRIVGAINPVDDGIYQVEDMEPALLDRFNCYDFRPSVEEWIYWASKVKVDNNVIGFISRHNDLLDPPIGSDQRANEVYPSRRSWKRVSDIINGSPDLLGSPDTLSNILLGIVGTGATSSFSKYLRENNKGIHAGTLITKFHERREEFENKIVNMNVQDLVALNREIVVWFNDNTEMLKAGNRGTVTQYSANLQFYLEACPLEAMGQFFNLLTEDNKTKAWPKIVLSLNRALGQKMVNSIRGNSNKPTQPKI